MFSGIVTGQGTLTNIKVSSQKIRLTVKHHGLGRGVNIGDSVAINGCCLTVVRHHHQAFEFDVLGETWKRTSLSRIQPPERVNLECSLKFGDPIGGHFVTGHIDGVGQIILWQKEKKNIFIKIRPVNTIMRWILQKGSVAVDGISLTIATVSSTSFGVCLTPYTCKITTLGWKRKGDFVNLEADMIVKCILGKK